MSIPDSQWVRRLRRALADGLDADATARLVAVLNIASSVGSALRRFEVVGDAGQFDRNALELAAAIDVVGSSARGERVAYLRLLRELAASCGPIAVLPDRIVVSERPLVLGRRPRRRDDAIVVHEGWLRVGLYLGQAGGQLAGEDLYPVPSSNGGNPHGLAVGDVTADGWPDIVIADDLHGLLILPNVGEVAPPSPSFTPPPSPSYTLPPPTPTPAPTPTPTPTPQPTPAPTPTPTPAPVPPSAPQSLAASPNLAAGVGLTWQPPAVQGTFPVTGYRIYRGTGGGTPTPLVTVGNVLAFTDASVANGTTYRYRVSAISAAGEGASSTEVSAARGTAPTAPRNLTATTTKSGIEVTWTAPSSNGGTAITGYRVYRGAASGAETLYVSYGPDAIGMTDTNVAKKARYFYRVTAVNVLGESVFSAEVNATAR